MVLNVRDASGNGPGNQVPMRPDDVVSGTWTGTTTGTSDSVVTNGKCNITITKTGSAEATVTIEKSTDGGTTFVALSKNADGDAASYATTVDFNGSVEDIGESLVYYRLNNSAHGVSGDVDYRLSAVR